MCSRRSMALYAFGRIYQSHLCEIFLLSNKNFPEVMRKSNLSVTLSGSLKSFMNIT